MLSVGWLLLFSTPGAEWEGGLYFFIFKGLVAFIEELSFVFILEVLCQQSGYSLFPCFSALLLYSPPGSLSTCFCLFSVALQWKSVSALSLSLTAILASLRCCIIKIKWKELIFDFSVMSQHALPFSLPLNSETWKMLLLETTSRKPTSLS